MYMEAAKGREILSQILTQTDPTEGLWEFVHSGQADEIIPEFTSLRLEQDPVHRHKDVLTHTIAVTAKTRPDLVLRLAALFHDIGKPATRKYSSGGVTFYHHEAVGARIAKKRLRVLEFPSGIVNDVSELVRLSGHFKGYMNGWNDSAVRRYARRAGHLLGLLNELVRSDCTSRNPEIYKDLQDAVDDLEKRLNELAEQEQKNRERPLMNGEEVMEYLKIDAGPEVGRALKFLLELKQTEPELSLIQTRERLLSWWEKQKSQNLSGS